MKKTLRNAFIAVLAIVSLSANAQTQIVFDATVLQGTSIAANNADELNKDGIKIACSNAAFKVSNYNTKKSEYRFYKNSKTTITSTKGNIIKVEFTCLPEKDKKKGTIKYGAAGFTDTENYSYTEDEVTGTWEGDAASVTLSANVGQVRASKVVVTIKAAEAGVVEAPQITGTTPFVTTTEVTITAATGAKIYYTLNNEVPTVEKGTLYKETIKLDKTTTVKAIAVKDGKTSSVAEKTFTKEEVKVVNSIAEYKQLAAKEKATLKLNDAQVLYTWTTNKGNTSTYVRDNSGAILFYQAKANLGLKQNEMLKGEITGTFDLYNKIPELVYAAGLTNLDKVERTAGSDAKPKAIKVGEAMDNLCDLVALDKVKFTVKESTDKKGNPVKNFYVVDGDKKVQIYNGFHLDAYKDMAFDAETEYNVVGIVGSVYKEVPSIYIIKVEKNTADGINTVATETINANAPMYNLAGQRVGKNYKGVVIQNGKKFINK